MSNMNDPGNVVLTILCCLTSAPACLYLFFGAFLKLSEAIDKARGVKPDETKEKIPSFDGCAVTVLAISLMTQVVVLVLGWPGVLCGVCVVSLIAWVAWGIFRPRAPSPPPAPILTAPVPPHFFVRTHRHRRRRRWRASHCYSCHTTVDNSVDETCEACGWIICHNCRACGCNRTTSRRRPAVLETVDDGAGGEAASAPPLATAADWDTSTRSGAKLWVLGGRASNRKLRLFSCACCYTVVDWLTDEQTRRAIAQVESHPDASLSDGELERLQQAVLLHPVAGHARADAFGLAAQAVLHLCDTRDDQTEGARRAYEVVALVRRCKERAAQWNYLQSTTLRGESLPALLERVGDQARGKQVEAECSLLEDITGNPDRPVPVAPAWLAWNDGAVRKITQAIYDGRRFADLPLLADALEEAGCDNADILSHCRRRGEHVRGCWVVDLLLGKQ